MNDMTSIAEQAPATARFTVDEFMHLIETHALEGMGRFELSKGELVRMSPLSRSHMRYGRQVFLELHEAIKDVLPGRIAQFECSIQIGSNTVRDIDVAIASEFEAGRSFLEPEAVLLAVEVSVTTTEYDLQEKRVDYAGAAIPHYWVVDVENARTHVMSKPLDGDYTERRLVNFGEPLAVPGTDRSIVIR